MTAIDFEKDINNLLEQFDNIDVSNISEILAWFYDALKYQMIFEDSTFISYFLSCLNKYKIDRKAKTHISKSLVMKDGKYNASLIGQSLINDLITDLEMGTGISELNKILLKIYNQQFVTDLTAKKMMDNLANNIGDEVVYSGIIDSSHFLKVGILQELEPYKAVKIDNERIPFIGSNVAIFLISSVNHGELYKNHFVKDDYSLTDIFEIDKLHQKSFGIGYKEYQRKIY